MSGRRGTYIIYATISPADTPAPHAPHTTHLLLTHHTPAPKNTPPPLTHHPPTPHTSPTCPTHITHLPHTPQYITRPATVHQPSHLCPCSTRLPTPLILASLTPRSPLPRDAHPLQTPASAQHPYCTPLWPSILHTLASALPPYHPCFRPTTCYHPITLPPFLPLYHLTTLASALPPYHPCFRPTTLASILPRLLPGSTPAPGPPAWPAYCSSKRGLLLGLGGSGLLLGLGGSGLLLGLGGSGLLLALGGSGLLLGLGGSGLLLGLEGSGLLLGLGVSSLLLGLGGSGLLLGLGVSGLLAALPVDPPQPALAAGEGRGLEEGLGFWGSGS